MRSSLTGINNPTIHNKISDYTNNKLKLNFTVDDFKRVEDLTPSDVLNDRYCPPEMTKVVIHNLDMMKSLAQGLQDRPVIKSKYAPTIIPTSESLNKLALVIEAVKKYDLDHQFIQQYINNEKFPMDHCPASRELLRKNMLMGGAWIGQLVQYITVQCVGIKSFARRL